MIESDGGYGIFIVSAVGDGLDQCGLSCILKPDNCDLKFLGEELTLDPVEYFINESHHLILLCCP